MFISFVHSFHYFLDYTANMKKSEKIRKSNYVLMIQKLGSNLQYPYLHTESRQWNWLFFNENAIHLWELINRDINQFHISEKEKKHNDQYS